jgi:Zn-dependent protease with chaperone function
MADQQRTTGTQGATVLATSALGTTEQLASRDQLVKLASGKKLTAIVWIMLVCGVLQVLIVGALVFMSRGEAQKDELFFVIPMVFTFILAFSAYSNSKTSAQKMLSQIDQANADKA